MYYIFIHDVGEVILDFVDEMVNGVLKIGYLKKRSCETQLDDKVHHTAGEHHELLCIQGINEIKVI